ncbi:MAG TPA: Gfo/Idh/MocA family oxidoreductase [Micropepsaceae bacterium]|nr:Gfo/Idh/MocA family oxidoreductase [Micropepsaceae bacterium]
MNIHRVASQPVLKAAVVGAGVFGRHHASKYQSLAGVELIGIADPDEAARAKAATALGVPVHADWKELLGKADLVSICSPAVTHAGLVRAFLSHNSHVLVEKPIATNVRDGEQLIALARTRGLVLTVGHQERYVVAGGGLLDIKETPRVIECVREGPWTGRGTDVSVVLDLMIHDLDLVHALLPGQVTDLDVEGQFVYGQSHDAVTAHIVFDNGAAVHLSANRAAAERKRLLRLVYRGGAEIEIDFLTRQVRNTTKARLKPLDLTDPLADSIGGFVAAVRLGAPVLVRPEEALSALKTALLVEDALVPAAVVRKRRALRRTA